MGSRLTRWICPGISLRTRYFFLPCLFDRGANRTQGVYIYQPTKPGRATAERPSKRRKVAPAGNQSDIQCFVPLLNGDETAECVQLRYRTYQQLWSEQEHKIQVSRKYCWG